MEDKILIINVLATTKITNVSDLVKKKKNRLWSKNIRRWKKNILTIWLYQVYNWYTLFRGKKQKLVNEFDISGISKITLI